MKTPGEVIAFARENGIRVIDFRFVDLPGIWQHFSIPVRNLTEELKMVSVLMVHPSAVSRRSMESDMILIPDARTAFVDVFTQEPTLNILVMSMTRSRGSRIRAIRATSRAGRRST